MIRGQNIGGVSGSNLIKNSIIEIND